MITLQETIVSHRNGKGKSSSKLPFFGGDMLVPRRLYIYSNLSYMTTNTTITCAFYLLFNLPRSPGPQHPPRFLPPKNLASLVKVTAEDEDCWIQCFFALLLCCQFPTKKRTCHAVPLLLVGCHIAFASFASLPAWNDEFFQPFLRCCQVRLLFRKESQSIISKSSASNG